MLLAKVLDKGFFNYAIKGAHHLLRLLRPLPRPSSTPELAIFALIIALGFQRRRLESCKTRGARKNSAFSRPSGKTEI